MIKCSLPTVKFCDLIKKEVINTCNGCRLGYVCDVEIDVLCGKISNIFVPKPHNIFQKVQYYCIKWEQIERISNDMILVAVRD
ncbi:MAG: YlmC/YmxH family sporulation protein [Clostridia bacterium]|nr:YlmC/YmxH family sporulation protein [Clostridia bacterium]